MIPRQVPGRPAVSAATVLITGGTGSFGSTMVAHLLARGVGSVHVLSRDEAQAVVAKAVGYSKADGVSVQVNSGYRANVRFAANQMSTAGATLRSASCTFGAAACTPTSTRGTAQSRAVP